MEEMPRLAPNTLLESHRASNNKKNPCLTMVTRHQYHQATQLERGGLAKLNNSTAGAQEELVAMLLPENPCLPVSCHI